MEVATAEGLTSHADTLRKGGAWLALGCLSWLSPDFSLSGIKYHDNRIEGLGRHLWCTQNGASAGKMPPAAQLQGYAPDTFCKDNRVQMPASWPERCILPIGLRDLSALPAKKKISWPRWMRWWQVSIRCVVPSIRRLPKCRRILLASPRLKKKVSTQSRTRWPGAGLHSPLATRVAEVSPQINGRADRQLLLVLTRRVSVWALFGWQGTE